MRQGCNVCRIIFSQSEALIFHNIFHAAVFSIFVDLWGALWNRLSRPINVSSRRTRLLSSAFHFLRLLWKPIKRVLQFPYRFPCMSDRFPMKMSDRVPVHAGRLNNESHLFPSFTGSVKESAIFLARVAGAINYVYVGNLEAARRKRISKSAAVLVGFFIFHSLPNILLTSRSGRKKYSNYGVYQSGSRATRVIELFLLGAGLTHAVLSSKKSIMRIFSRRPLQEDTKSWEMLMTGTVIALMMIVHLGHFRFRGAENAAPLDQRVVDLLDRRDNRVRNVLYWFFVITVAFHAWRGNSHPWLYRLGFRGRQVPVLHRVCQILIVLSAVLYTIPLRVENPRVPENRIISVD